MSGSGGSGVHVLTRLSDGRELNEEEAADPVFEAEVLVLEALAANVLESEKRGDPDPVQFRYSMLTAFYAFTDRYEINPLYEGRALENLRLISGSLVVTLEAIDRERILATTSELPNRRAIARKLVWNAINDYKARTASLSGLKARLQIVRDFFDPEPSVRSFIASFEVCKNAKGCRSLVEGFADSVQTNPKSGIKSFARSLRDLFGRAR